MRYEAFHFSNFRGIKDARLNLRPNGADARVFTLVGLNECGKTTLLEVIDYFLPSDDETDFGPKQLAGWARPEPHELIPISERANFNDKVIVKAIISLNDADVEVIKKRSQEALWLPRFRAPPHHRSRCQIRFQRQQICHAADLVAIRPREGHAAYRIRCPRHTRKFYASLEGRRGGSARTAAAYLVFSEFSLRVP